MEEEGKNNVNITTKEITEMENGFMEEGITIERKWEWDLLIESKKRKSGAFYCEIREEQSQHPF